MALKEELARTIMSVIEETLALKGATATSLSLDSRIDQTLGLDSLDWAAIVAVLEEKTQVDPFQRGLRQDLHTLGDLVELYFSEINPSIELDRAVP